jgi:hypothetical protein
VKKADSPRLYVIRKPDGKLIRRNSQHVEQTSVNVNFEREPSIHVDIMVKNGESDVEHPDGVERNHRQLTPRNGFHGFESQLKLDRLSTVQMGSKAVGDRSMNVTLKYSLVSSPSSVLFQANHWWLAGEPKKTTNYWKTFYFMIPVW